MHNGPHYEIFIHVNKYLGIFIPITLSCFLPALLFGCCFPISLLFQVLSPFFFAVVFDDLMHFIRVASTFN